jgi:RimJ/RimL family protein N-acetyltransferase
MTMIIQTERLHLRLLTTEDAEFYLRLVNDASFINNIRDKGIRTLDAAKETIQKEHNDIQTQRGFSLYLIERKSDQQAIGLCGFVKREELPDIDVGYALLPEMTNLGYAHEALTSLLYYGKEKLQLSRLLAITSLHNESSIKLLEKVGFQFQEIIPWKNEEEVNLYTLNLLS